MSLLSTIVILLNCCNSEYSGNLYDQWKKGGSFTKLQNIYPAEGTVIPPEMAPVTVIWEQETQQCNKWNVIVEAGGEILASSGLLDTCAWKPEAGDWEKIKSSTIGKDGRIIILGCSADSPDILLAACEVRFSTSRDSVGAPIFFRTVPLPFQFANDNLDRISWCLGNVASANPPHIVVNKLIVCGNCHSFSADGKVLGMDVDYANDKGSYVLDEMAPVMRLTPDKIITWSSYHRDDDIKTFGLLSNVSPDGRFVASTVKDRSIFVPVDNKFYSQLFFPIKGIIAIYDRQKNLFTSLPGADDPEFVQSNPVWSPDGKNLLFTKTKAYISPEAEKSEKIVLPTSYAKEFLDGSHRFFYDIYTIPFNNGKGGVAHKLPGASDNGKSNYFPRYSPDGKWLVFTQAENFMLLQGDSKLYIMPAAGGTPRLMNCNTNQMNSWHSFSPNGKWLVFSSKKRGPYTKLYLTHIDENGNDSPPVCLEYFTPDTLAANIPEFVNINPNSKFVITKDFLNSDYYHGVKAFDNVRSGNLPGALRELEQALQYDSKDFMLYMQKSIIEDQMGLNKKAMDDINKCIELDKDCAEAYSHRANLKCTAEDYPGANEDLVKAIKLDPNNYMSVYYYAYTLFHLHDYTKSVEECNKVIALAPEYSYSYFLRAMNNIHLKKKKTIICSDLQKADELGCPEARQTISEYCGGI